MFFLQRQVQICECNSGLYSSSGYGYSASTACTSCPAGKFNPNIASTVCYACPAGSYCPSSAGEVYYRCLSGKYAAAGASSCSTCTAGKYSNVGAGACSSCDTGRVAAVDGTSASCLTLIVTMSDSYGDGWNDAKLYIGPYILTIGTGSSATGNICLAAGQYAPYACGGEWSSEISWSVAGISGGGVNDCSTATSPGSFTISGPSCTACTAGNYAAATGLAACTSCAAGKYQGSIASSSCNNCPAVSSTQNLLI